MNREVYQVRILIVASLLVPWVALGTPRIVVDEPEFHFGEQANNQRIDHTFVVRNEGDSKLLITNIRSSCGCTVGNVTSREIDPGETSEITASYNLRGRRGRQRSVLTIESNDPDQRQTRLTMSGYALQEMTVRPTTVVFGQVPVGSRSQRQVELTGVSDLPFQVERVEIQGDGFDVIDQEEIAPHHHRLSIETVPDGESGHRRATLVVHTSHPRVPVVQVPLNADWAGALSVAPAAITLMAGSDRPVTRFIVVRPAAVTDFEITEVIVPSDSIETAVLSLPNQSYRIQLRNVVASDELNGQSVRIRTNVDDLDDLEVPFTLIDPNAE